jgi:uncharacterized protein (DUF302 family)
MTDALQKVFLILVVLFFASHIYADNIVENIQVFSSPNSDKKITPKSIETAFNQAGLTILGNNNMNKPFLQRFENKHYEIYNLAMFMNTKYNYKLLKKYPQFGALTPLTMSIWQDKKGNMNIATLNIQGIARAANIPATDKDLHSYASLIHKALKKAMPHGHFKKSSLKPTTKNNSYQINFTANVHLENGEDLEDFIDDFEEEFEAEMESLGFLFPNITNVQDEIFKKYDYKVYDFYHTYSICKFDVIYPVSKDHPEAGAWAPCSFYIYKKKDEDKMQMGFLGVDNWIKTLNIKDKTSIIQLKEAEAMIEKILNDMIE